MSTAGSTCGVCSALLVAATAFAGPVQQWTLESLAKADVLAVARVESVTPGPGPVRQVGDRLPVYTCTADLAVLRSFGRIADRAMVQYECYRDRGPGVSGYPMLPILQRGDVRVFPLKRAGESWTLLGNDGIGLLMPALPESANMAGTALGFLVDELANQFLQGTYRQMYEAAQYGRFHSSKLLMERIATDLPDGDPRWLDIASVALASTGIPRPPLNELRGFPGEALAHVPANRRREGIVRSMLRHSDVHVWGSAATLVPEFKDDPLLLRLLPGYLAKSQPGAVSIAWWLAQHQQFAVMPPALDAALRTILQPDMYEMPAATGLIVKHGSDAQFTKLLDALREAKEDRPRYVQLWQMAYGEDGPRIRRMIAIWLADERAWAANTTMRFCDVAGGRLQMIAKEDFGFKQWDQPLGERQAALKRARAWLRDRI